MIKSDAELAFLSIYVPVVSCHFWLILWIWKMITQEDVRKSKWIVLHTNVMTRDRRPTSRHEHLKYSCYKYMKSSISSNYIHFYRVLCAMARATPTDESCWYKKLHSGTNTATRYLSSSLGSTQTLSLQSCHFPTLPCSSRFVKVSWK